MPRPTHRLVHCRTKEEAQRVLAALAERMKECGLTLHPNKTKVVYCKGSGRQDKHEFIQFDFLGYTFGPRRSMSRVGKAFLGFLPAMSRAAEHSIRQKLRDLKIKSATFLSLDQLSVRLKPYLQGWMNYYCHFYKSQFCRIGSYVNSLLVNWAMRKFKYLRQNRYKAMLWLQRVIDAKPDLFPHWSRGLYWMSV